MGKGLFVCVHKKVKSFLYWHCDYDRIGEHRIKKAIKIWKKGGVINKFRAGLMFNKTRWKYNAYFDPGITVGKNLRIEHCFGIVIGTTAILGDNVKIYQNVNIISKVIDKQNLDNNNLRRHAKIGNNVILGANCMIIGAVTIGDYCVIAAGAIVTKDIPPGSLVVNVNEVRPRNPGQAVSESSTSLH